MADRPKYFCRDCGYQWFAHGPQHNARCPGCRGPNVAPVLSLDEEAPAPRAPAASDRPSRLPKILMLVIGGLVLHAVAGTLGFVMLRGDKPREHEVAAANPAPTSTPTPAPKVAPKTTTPPQPKVILKSKVTPEPVEPDPTPPDPPVKTPEPKTPDPAPEPTPKTPEPVTKTPEPTTKTPDPTLKPPEPAPKPPEPMASPFPPPPGSWVSAWEKAGDVRIRITGVAVTKVPLEVRKRKVLSPEPYFVVWVEVENTSKTNHTYRRWQPVTTGECTIKHAVGTALGYAIYPTDHGREWFSEFNQPLPAGGPPVTESLVFSRPDPNAEGPMTLTLDATRAGGTGRVAIEIPHAVWARR